MGTINIGDLRRKAVGGRTRYDSRDLSTLEVAMRIVALGGGFGGVATVRHLERLLRSRADVELTLVSRENFFVINRK